jgi:hypothetical protein
MVANYNKMGNDEGSKQKQHSNTMSSDGDLSEPIRLRCTSCQNNGIDGFLLDYNAFIILFGGPILHLIFYII